MIKVKKGASFRLALEFTDDEWDSLMPAEQIMSQFKQGDKYTDLEVEMDEQLKCIFIRAETTDWKIGIGEFDIKLVQEGKVMVIPELSNVQIQVLRGITK